VPFWFKKNAPEVIRGQLADRLRRHGVPLHFLLDFLLRNLVFNFLTRPDFVAYRVEERRNPALWLCKKLYGVQEVSWTIRDAHTMQQMQEKDSIIIFEGFLPADTSINSAEKKDDGPL